MPRKRMVLQLGMGTSLRHESYTDAARRAVDNALRQNALTVADAFGVAKTDMQVEIHIGAQRPDLVDADAVAGVPPYGRAQVTVEKGGMDVAKDDGQGVTVMVNAAVVVYLEVA